MNDAEVLERDKEWRDAIAPGNAGSLTGKLCSTPEGAGRFIEAMRDLHHEDLIYFEKRAEKARNRRREAESQLLKVAECWERSVSVGCDPHFSIGAESLLRAALAKKKRKLAPPAPEPTP